MRVTERRRDVRIFEAKDAECNLVRTQRLHVLMTFVYIRSDGSRMQSRANTKATRTNDVRIFEAKEAECNLVRTQRLHVLMLVFLFREDGLG